MKILIVEGDKQLAAALQTVLRRRGFTVQTVSDCETGAAYAWMEGYDLLVLDGRLPCGGGYEFARQYRARQGKSAILMLAPGPGAEDRVAALYAGADYTLARPLDMRELVACVHALLRRQSGQSNVLAYGDVELELEGGLLRCGEGRVRLSAREFDLMRLLFQAGERPVAKETLLTRVWGCDSNAVDNNVEVYVGLLRKKLRSVGSGVRIVAIRRVGYHLEQPAG